MKKRTYAGVAQTSQPSKRYASDSTDKEGAMIAPKLAQADGPGRKRTVDLREIVNAIFYRTRTGCQWRMLPKEFPDWRHVWSSYKKWTTDGTWQLLNDALRRLVRRVVGKHPDPSLPFWRARPSKRPKPGANGDLTAARKSTDENGISWLIPSVYCSCWWFTRPISRITMALDRSYHKPQPSRAGYKRSWLTECTPKTAWATGSNSNSASCLKSSLVISNKKGL